MSSRTEARIITMLEGDAKATEASQDALCKARTNLERPTKVTVVVTPPARLYISPFAPEEYTPDGLYDR